MSNIPTPSALQTEDEQGTTLDEMFTEMRRLNELMRQDQVEIDRLKAETALLRAETREILARLGAVL